MREKKQLAGRIHASFVTVSVRSPVIMHGFYCRFLGFSPHYLADLYQHRSIDPVIKTNNLSQRDSNKETKSYIFFQILMHRSAQGILIFTHTLTDRSHIPVSEPSLLDRGILALKMRCRNISLFRKNLFNAGCEVSRLSPGPAGCLSFFLRDPEYNWIYLYEEAQSVRRHARSSVAHVETLDGFILSTDIDMQLQLYESLGMKKELLYDLSEKYSDLDVFTENQELRRVGITLSSSHENKRPTCMQEEKIELLETVPNMQSADSGNQLCKIQHCSIVDNVQAMFIDFMEGNDTYTESKVQRASVFSLLAQYFPGSKIGLPAEIFVELLKGSFSDTYYSYLQKKDNGFFLANIFNYYRWKVIRAFRQLRSYINNLYSIKTVK